MRRTTLIFLYALALLSGRAALAGEFRLFPWPIIPPVSVEEPEEPAEEEPEDKRVPAPPLPQAAEEEHESPFVAAAWCPLQSESDEAEEDGGCDAGIGVSLFGRGRWRIVAAVGSHSLGPGIAYVALRPKNGPVVAVAAGLMVFYDSTRIDTHPRLHLGATFGF